MREPAGVGRDEHGVARRRAGPAVGGHGAFGTRSGPTAKHPRGAVAAARSSHASLRRDSASAPRCRSSLALAVGCATREQAGGGEPRPACAQPRASAAYTARMARALRARTDVWGEELLAAPGGPTYARRPRLVSPLLLAGAPRKQRADRVRLPLRAVLRARSASGARSVALAPRRRREPDRRRPRRRPHAHGLRRPRALRVVRRPAHAPAGWRTAGCRSCGRATSTRTATATSRSRSPPACRTCHDALRPRRPCARGARSTCGSPSRAAAPGRCGSRPGETRTLRVGLAAAARRSVRQRASATTPRAPRSRAYWTRAARRRRVGRGAGARRDGRRSARCSSRT